MSVFFTQLTAEEKEFMFSVPALACILIGGADDHFDEIERKTAKEITHIKSYTSNQYLKDYYTKVSETFVSDVDAIMATLPEKASERNPMIREQLKKVNAILDKLDPHFSKDFNKTVIEIAKYVADASGGVIGFLSVSTVEQEEIANLTLVLN